MKRRDVGSPWEYGGRRLRDTIIDFLDFANTSLGDDLVRNSMLRDLGAVNLPAAGTSWQFPENQMQSIRAYRSSADFDSEQLASFMGDVVAYYDFLSTLTETIVEDNDLAVSIKGAIFDLLAANYVRMRFPFLFWIAQPFGFLDATIAEHSQSAIYSPTGAARGLWGLIKAGALDDEDQAREFSLLTFVPVAVLLAFGSSQLDRFDTLNEPTVTSRQPALLGLDIPRDPDRASLTPAADEVLQRILSFAMHGSKIDGSFDAAIIATLVWMPAEHGGPGLYVALGGSETLATNIADRWKLTLDLGSDGAIAAIIANPPRLLGPGNARAKVTIEPVDAPPDPDAQTPPTAEQAAGRHDDRVSFPDRTGTHIEFGRLALTGELSTDRAALVAAARNGVLVIDASDGDGFLAKVLPRGETRIDFALGIGLDTERGLYIEGGSGLQAVFPVGKTIGPVHIQTVAFGVGAAPEPARGTRVEISAGFSVTLGAFSASVDRIGFVMDLEFPERDGIDWPTPTFGFKPPNGIGLVVNHSEVTGGGFLYFDPDNHRYAGIVHLQYGEIAFKAIGLIDTRVGDKSGFSLLLIASAEGFTPLELGFGFSLTGIGGIVGYNRTADVNVLRSGLRNGNLDSVLYPENPVRDAPRIIAGLRQIFPPKDGQFLVGLTGVIEWGARSIVSLDVGIVLEAPTPWRLLLLGQLKARFPQNDDKALVRINIDFVGDINFDEGTLAFDATLRESQVFKFALTGDAALRMRYRNDPTFALSVGGFHPAFTAPVGFPSLERLTLELAKSSKLKVRLAGYLAITSATVQFGARVDLFVKAGGFSVEGFLSFDALLDWSTCEFRVDLGGGVTVRWKGRTLFGIYLEATLTGPADLRIRGKAKLKIWRWTYTKSFNQPLGNNRAITAVSADPLPELLAALRDPNGWTDELTSSRTSVTSLRGDPSQPLLVNPIGALVVRQNVVPLNTTISLYGGTAPKNATRFTIDAVTVGERPAAPATVTDYFAAGQFVQMSDAERLVRPSFELMDAGVRLSSDEVRYGGQADPTHMVQLDIEHETNLVDENDVRRPHLELTWTAADFELVMATTAVGRAARRSADRFAAAVDVAGDAAVYEPRFALARTDKLEAVEPIATVATVTGLRYTEALEALERYSATSGSARTALQIVRDDELQVVEP